MTSSREREMWVDEVKIIACALVVLGHFFQSMTMSEILPNGPLNEWFQMTIYTFHVPLFFVCSGYLYQQYSKVTSVNAWWRNVRKKLLVLGVPYVAFTCATLAIKAFVGDAVNTQESGAIYTLFLHPTAPYWYLYTLFFVFMLTPTLENTASAITLVLLSALARVAVQFGGGLPSIPYAVSSVMRYECWFALGMSLSALGWRSLLTRNIGIACLAFLPLSIVVYLTGMGEIARFVLGVVAVICVISLCSSIDVTNAPKWVNALSYYTMPIYLMHTIFAAGTRVVLLRLGIDSTLAHVSLGIAAGFVGPMLAMLVLKLLSPLDFIVYPSRYVKM